MTFLLFAGPSPSLANRFGLRRTRPSPIEKLIPNQSASALTARTCALQNCMSLIPKTKQALRMGHDEPLHSKQLAYF
jgi:hypothetical protein